MLLSELEDFARDCIHAENHPDDDHFFNLFQCHSCRGNSFNLTIEHHTGSEEWNFKGIIWGECASCGEIAGEQTTVTCRTWHWKGEVYSSAPVGKIVESILNAATAGTRETSACCSDTGDAYALPENLDGFFRARDDGEARCC